MHLPSVSLGVVVGKRVCAFRSSGPVPTAHTNLVPPASIAPYKHISGPIMTRWTPGPRAARPHEPVADTYKAAFCRTSAAERADVPLHGRLRGGLRFELSQNLARRD